MNKYKHLTQEERNIIEHRLIEKESIKSIDHELDKDPTTITKEVRSHIQFRKTGCYGKTFNNCLMRKDCTAQHLCGNRKCNRYCRFCNTHLCSSLCTEYKEEICHRLSKPPYVCNGCEGKKSCTLKKKDNFKVNKKCRMGRTYQDFLKFIGEHPGLPIVEMDSLEGKKGGKVLLTLHFTIPQFMLAFIRDANTSQSVIDIFNRLYLELSSDIFIELFQVLLGDNGSEFSNPSAIEMHLQGKHMNKPILSGT